MQRSFVCDIPISRVNIFTNFATTTAYLKERDLYKILGVPRNCTQQDIKEAYFKKAKIVHPDSVENLNILDGSRKSNKHQAFNDIKYAYDILKKPASRKLYDEGIDPFINQQYRYSNRSKKKKYSYSHDYYNFNDSRKSFYSENTDFRVKSEEIRKQNEEEWKNVLIVTSFGIFVVFLYQVGYLIMLNYKEKKLEKLSKKDEIARSFIRQFGDKERLNSREELDKYGKILSDDIEEAYKRRLEEFGNYNPKEILEE
uniref:J domain-containing protein n=1 Tax=Strongyloides venezuelensis TaxID=75913 RepID=A0A0K0F7U2_STRVS